MTSGGSEIAIRMRVGQPFGASNKPGTCLWCGRRLRQVSREYKPFFDGALGSYGDNAFCGLRCGYQFGVASASHGFRFNPDNEK